MQSDFCAATAALFDCRQARSAGDSIRPEDDRASLHTRRTATGTACAAPVPPAVKLGEGYLICMPEIAREMTRRWISEVPSKMV
jgi:hypothetical protein